ncbi:MAG: adenylate/guanylate cyclase domain-containing protein [Spirochaetota bacterium]
MNEIEKLNEFSNRINSMTDLDDILKDIFDYVGETFGIEGVWLLKVDSEKNTIFTLKVPRSMGGFPLSAVRYVQNFNAPLEKETGSLWHVVNKKKHMYLRSIRKVQIQGKDKELVKVLDVKSVLQVPLIIHDTVIGVACFTKHGHRLKLSLEDIQAIVRFTNQVAGAIQTSTLLKQIQEEKTKAERLREEVELLNEFSKNLNQSTSFDTILEKVFEYIRLNFAIDAILLALPNKEETKLNFYSFSQETSMNEEQSNFLYNESIPIGEDNGVIAKTFLRRRPFYVKRIKTVSNKFDKNFVDAFHVRSFLLEPLVVNEHSIGLLFLTRKDEKTLNLSHKEISTIQKFCEQIAGAVNTTSLLKKVHEEREKSEKLLLNILPGTVAEELKESGFVEPRSYDSVTVLFTDFVGFTKIAETISPADLVKELDGCFSQFDDVVSRNQLEKLKTIGDAYMCAGGLPVENNTHPIDACLAALEFREFMIQMEKIKQSINFPYWQLRIGMNTGPITAGVIGKNKFAYDIWGDTVNTASRMESTGVPGKINISHNTWLLVKDFFACEYRGEIQAKGKGMVKMYFLNQIHSDLSMDEYGLLPNEMFFSMYNRLK